jgi:hypothetical protein
VAVEGGGHGALDVELAALILEDGLVAPGFEAEYLAAVDREAALEDGGEDGSR